MHLHERVGVVHNLVNHPKHGARQRNDTAFLVLGTSDANNTWRQAQQLKGECSRSSIQFSGPQQVIKPANIFLLVRYLPHQAPGQIHPNVVASTIWTSTSTCNVKKDGNFFLRNFPTSSKSKTQDLAKRRQRHFQETRNFERQQGVCRRGHHHIESVINLLRRDKAVQNLGKATCKPFHIIRLKDMHIVI